MSNYTFLEGLIREHRDAYWEPDRYSSFTYAECGVYRGKTFFQVYNLCEKLFERPKCYAVDSFAGFPDIVVEEDGDVDKGHWKDYANSFYFGCVDRPDIRIVKTNFSDLEANMPHIWYDLVFLDCDLYHSYLDCLNFFHDKTNLMVLDEYYSLKYPGAKIAVDEWLKKHPEWQLFCQIEQNPYWERWGMRREG